MGKILLLVAMAKLGENGENKSVEHESLKWLQEHKQWQIGETSQIIYEAS